MKSEFFVKNAIEGRKLIDVFRWKQQRIQIQKELEMDESRQKRKEELREQERIKRRYDYRLISGTPLPKGWNHTIQRPILEMQVQKQI